MMSPDITALATALSAFQGEMKAVGFDAVNPFFKSQYTKLSTLVEKASPILAKHGLAVTQIPCDNSSVETILMHKSGQWIGNKVTLTPTKNDAQGVGSAITYARRYAYAGILGLVSEADDDGNHASTPVPASKVAEVKEAIKSAPPVKATPAPVAKPANAAEYSAVIVSHSTKNGTSRATGKAYSITSYVTQGDLGEITIDVFGKAIEGSEWCHATFFDFKEREYQGKPQFGAAKVVINKPAESTDPKDIAWEE